MSIKSVRRIGGSLAFIGAAVAAVLMLTASPSANAKPAVSWTPASVTETVLAGETVTVPVTFTASENLTNTVIRIVPELEPYVAVEPSSFEDVAKGETVNLDLVVVAPTTALPGSFDGIIQLRSGTKPTKNFARPLPIAVNVVWQSFTDPTGRYAISFRPDISADFAEDILTLSLPGIVREEEEPELRMSIDENPEGLTIEEYYDGSPGRNLFEQSDGTSMHVVVGGVAGRKFEPFVSFAGEVIIVLPTNEAFIKINDLGNSFHTADLFDLILETIQL